MANCKYKIRIPLVYNKYAVDSLEYNVENIFDFIGECECVLPNDKSIENSSDINLSLYSEKSTVFVELSSIVSNSKQNAYVVANQILSKLCARLSLEIVRNDPNKAIFQPRFEPDWMNSNWEQESIMKEEDILFGGGFKVSLKDECSMSFSQHVYSEDIQLKEWMEESDENLLFLINEYYFALGTEVVTSKFMHLFTLIEWCEKKFEKYNLAKVLLDEKQRDEIVDLVKGNVDEQVRTQIAECISDSLAKKTDIGRKEKLLNILHYLGIDKIRYNGSDKFLDIHLIGNLIYLRNKLFHAGATNVEERDKYKKAVVDLFCIDEQIIDYYLKANKNSCLRMNNDSN